MFLAGSSASGYIDKASRSIGWRARLVKGYLDRRGTVMIRRLTCVCLVLVVIGAVGCKSEKPEGKSASEVSEDSGAESKFMAENAEEQPEEKAAPKPDARMMMVKCPDCGKEFRQSADKKMMVCSGCGKEVDMKTFGQMGMQKILEVMQQMKDQ